MPDSRQLNELAARRQLLVLEADLHRQLVAFEREQLRARLAGWQGTPGRVLGNPPLLLAGSALTGLLALRNWRKVLRWLPLGLAVFRWMRQRKGRKHT